MTSPINNTADSINSAISAVGAGSTVAPKNDPVVSRGPQSYETVTEQPGSSIKLSPEEQAVVTKLDSGLKALGAVRLGISLDENSKKPVIKIFVPILSAGRKDKSTSLISTPGLCIVLRAILIFMHF